MKLIVISIFALLIALSGVAIATRGKATFYEGDVRDGTCNFTTYTMPRGMYGVAMSVVNWADSAVCGACVQVTGPHGNRIKAMIVDQCATCDLNELDFFPDAFGALEDPDIGVIDVDWEVVDCGINTPIRLRAKEQASKYWFSMQVLNSNSAVRSLDYSIDGGRSWHSTSRQEYNFFELRDGTQTDYIGVRLTCGNGKQILVNGVNVNGGAETSLLENC